MLKHNLSKMAAPNRGSHSIQPARPAGLAGRAIGKNIVYRPRSKRTQEKQPFGHILTPIISKDEKENNKWNKVDFNL